MNPLDQLQDIHLPEQAGWWPLAWGWWILLIVAVLMVVGGIWWLWQRYQFNQRRRIAISLLQSIRKEQADWPQQLNQLLKRTAMSYAGRDNIAAYHGQQWVDVLLSAVKHPERLRQPLQQLQTLQYQSQAPTNEAFDEMTSCVKTWLVSAHFRQWNPDSVEVNHV